MPQRAQELQAWVQNCLGERTSLTSLAGDASFRSYYRVRRGPQSWILMDAPPPEEDLKPFISVTKALSNAGLTVPNIVDSDLSKGFLLLSDFGDNLYLESLTEKTVADLYKKAIAALIQMQTISSLEDRPVLAFDEALMHKELSYFKEWFLGRYLNLTLSLKEQNLLENFFEKLCIAIKDQPTVFVHRDFHSRNLMVLSDNNQENNLESNLGILDFQDAVWGPISYDLVSLLKDCYIEWPRDLVLTWAKFFWEEQAAASGAYSMPWSAFLRAFDLTGLQRHLKVLGIFSRLYLRDHKPRYLADMPRIMNYVLEVTSLYPECKAMHDWLESVVVPRFQAAHCAMVV